MRRLLRIDSFRVLPRGLVLASALLGGCGGSLNAIVDTVRYAVTPERAQPPRLDPNYKYLRLSIEGRFAYLARGSIDPSESGPAEVWYSANREVFRLIDGRVAGMVGTNIEWRGVSLPAAFPLWSAIAAMREFRWERRRDVMPGYHYGVKDLLNLRVVSAPAKNVIEGLNVSELTWFEESVVPSGPASPLPPSRYAVSMKNGVEEVQYGEQCLAPNFCFSWQRWPPQSIGSSDKK